MNKQKQNTPLLYLIVHRMILNKACGNFINKKKASLILSRSLKIKKITSYKVIKELEVFGLVHSTPTRNDDFNLEVFDNEDLLLCEKKPTKKYSIKNMVKGDE